MTFQIRPLSTADYPFVISVIDQWWGGRQMADKLPRLFFEHFTDTSFAAERRRSRPPAGLPVWLTSRNNHCYQEGEHQGPWNPAHPARQPGSRARPRPENQ